MSSFAEETLGLGLGGSLSSAHASVKLLGMNVGDTVLTNRVCTPEFRDATRIVGGEVRTPGRARQGAGGCSLPSPRGPLTRIRRAHRSPAGLRGPHTAPALRPRGVVPTAGVTELHVIWGGGDTGLHSNGRLFFPELHEVTCEVLGKRL